MAGGKLINQMTVFPGVITLAAAGGKRSEAGRRMTSRNGRGQLFSYYGTGEAMAIEG